VKEASIRSTHPERGGRYQVQSSGDRVWVNGPDGASVARISKHGGIDVHRPLSEQREHGECLDCRHDLRGAAAWEHFTASVLEHFGVPIAERHRPRWALWPPTVGQRVRVKMSGDALKINAISLKSPGRFSLDDGSGNSPWYDLDQIEPA
jgi:hypothetical protein